MLNQSISRYFILLIIAAGLISCSGSGEIQPEIIETQTETILAESSDQVNETAESRQGDSAEVVESPAEKKPISAVLVGADPAVAGVEFVADLNVMVTAEMPSYKNSSTDWDQTKARAVAQQFGMGDQIFIDEQSGKGIFYAFRDGNRMQIFPGQIQLTNTTALNTGQATFSANEVINHVERILATWQWPTFDYQVVPISSGSAEIRRLIDGKPVSFAEMSIQLSSNGELASFSLFMPELVPSEAGQIISAEEALDRLSSPSFSEANVQFEVGTNQVPEFQITQSTPPNSWRNRYPAGSEVNLTGTMTEFLPASESGDSILFLDRFRLDGAADMLNSLRQHGNNLVTVSGKILSDGSTLQMDLWSAADLSNTDTTAPLTGVIRLEGSNIFLDNSRLGNGYMLINPPNDIQPGSDVTVYQNFYFSNENGRFIEWNLVELQNPSTPQPPNAVTQTGITNSASKITIDQMEIAYGRPATGSDPSFIYAPVWRIYGTTDSGLSIVFNISAVK